MVSLVGAIAIAAQSLKNCQSSARSEMRDKNIARWDDTLANLENMLPRGSGFDSGSTIDIEETTETKVVLHTSYHKMSDMGYIGWFDYMIEVEPRFDGIALYVDSMNRGGEEDAGFVSDTFRQALTKDVGDIKDL